MACQIKVLVTDKLFLFQIVSMDGVASWKLTRPCSFYKQSLLKDQIQ